MEWYISLGSAKSHFIDQIAQKDDIHFIKETLQKADGLKCSLYIGYVTRVPLTPFSLMSLQSCVTYIFLALFLLFFFKKTKKNKIRRIMQLMRCTTTLQKRSSLLKPIVQQFVRALKHILMTHPKKILLKKDPLICRIHDLTTKQYSCNLVDAIEA